MRKLLIPLISIMIAGCATVPTPQPKADVVKAIEAPEKMPEKVPDTVAVKLTTTKGDVIIDVHRDWAPVGADRFLELVKIGYYNDLAFFRVIRGFMAQVGISGKPELNAKWSMQRIKDDPVKASNTRGMVTFGTGGPNTRTTQIFINYGNNSNLDGMGFSPFGKVRDMKAIDVLYSGYGEGAPQGRGPDQNVIQQHGNPYLKDRFPKLDYIIKAEILKQ
jgi:peptidyl-prolyl cis-trans isomerase A (cyclophilin A)